MGLAFDEKTLVAAMGPMLDKLEAAASERLTNQVIPAIGAQMQAGIASAVSGLNADSQGAIKALMDRVDALPEILEGIGERLIDKLFAEVRRTIISLGGVK